MRLRPARGSRLPLRRTRSSHTPDPVPVAVLGRLAIEQGYQGKGLGRALVKDALSRVAQAADIIGIRGIVVHAISPEAKAFDLAVGLEASRLHPMTLMATLADVQSLLIL